MATIDPNIALGIKPLQIENPMNQFAMMSQLQTGQNQNALAQYQLSAAQRADEATNVQNQLYAKHYNAKTGQIDKPAFLADLAANKQGSLIPKAQAQFAEQEYKENQGKKIVSEINKLDYDLGTNIFTQAQNELKQIDPRSPNATAQYLAYRERLYANPALANFFKNTGMTKEATDAQVKEAIKTPQGLADLILKSMTTAEQFQKILNDRGQLKVSQQNASTAAYNASINAQQLDLSKQNQQLLYGKDVVANTITDAAGNVTQFNRFGEVIGKPGNVGKPSATFEKTQALQKQLAKDLTTTISELKRVTEDKGLIDQSTGSGLGRLRDVGAGFFGGTTEGAIATAKLKPIADMVLKMVPRFEGPQSDKDTTSYKEAAGQLADPTIPNKIRKEAAKEIIRIMENRKGQFVTPEMASEGINAGSVDTNNPLLK
jgi:hypothetical protein